MKSRLPLLLLFVLVFWRLVLPFPHLASDLHHLYPEGLEANLIFPPTYRDFFTGDGLGQRQISLLWGWLIHPFFGLFSRLGIDYTYQMMAFGFLPIFIFSAWGIFKLFDKYKIGEWGKIAGALVYVANTYLILLIDGGQITLALAYSLVPLAFYYFTDSLEKPGLSARLTTSLIFLGISIFDPRVLYILGVILLIKVLFLLFLEKKNLHFLRNYFISGVFIVLTLFLYHSYWIIPVIYSRDSSLPQALGRSSQVDFLNFANLGHALFLQAPHWYKNVFGKVSPISWEFVFIPFLVFLAPIIKRKDKNVAFWLVISLVGIFLAKGVNEPFGNVYAWLFANVPGFSFFRDSTKFFFLIALSYSVLIGITLDELVKRYKWRLSIGRVGVPIVILLFSIYYLLITKPVWFGKMTGTFAKPIYESEYSQLAETLRNDNDFARTFWIPTKAPLGYASPVQPAIDAFKLLEKRPFASAVQGTYELFNFLRAPYTGELFDIAGIGYLIYPYPDERREELKPDNIDYYYWFTEKIADFPWVEEMVQDFPVKVFRTKKHQDKFFITQNVWWVIGSDDIYSELAKVESFNLSQNALVFAEEQPGLMEEIKNIESGRLILNKKTEIDIAASFIDEEELIFPASFLDFDPIPPGGSKGWPASRSFSEGWWKRETQDLISWRGFLQQKYATDNQDFDFGGGWAIAEGNTKLEIRNSKLEKGDVLLARVMRGPAGGKIKFYQGVTMVGEIETKEEFPEETVFEQEDGEDLQFSKAVVSWIEVGQLIEDGAITITTEGDINVVNALVSVSPENWGRLKEEAGKLLQERNVIILGKTSISQIKNYLESEGPPQVSYEIISPTHFKIEVRGLNKPSLIVFSSSYDPLWTLNGRGALLVYSFLNGFIVEKDGSYNLVFTPQRYVYPAILLSIVVIPALVLSIILLKNRNREV